VEVRSARTTARPIGLALPDGLVAVAIKLVAAGAQEHANHSNSRKVIASRIGTFRHGTRLGKRLCEQLKLFRWALYDSR
jgi:hypothetical protein